MWEGAVPDEGDHEGRPYDLPSAFCPLPSDPMNVRSTNVYVGPNVYANFPVIRQVIDLGVLEEWPTMRLGQDFVDALMERLPGLQEHGCSYGCAGGFVRRMTEDEGTWMGHVLEHVVIEFQHIAGSDVTFGKTRSTGTPGEYWMVFEYKQKDVGLEAARLGRELLLHLLPDATQRRRSTARPTTTSTGRRSATTSSATRSGASSGRARSRSSMQRRRGTFRGSGSTATASSNSATGSTRSAFRRR